MEVVSGVGRRLTVHPGQAPEGTTLTGATVESDQGKRLLGKVRGKCAKTADAGTAWIWVEDHSGLFHFPMPFAEMSLAAKTDALADLLGPALDDADRPARGPPAREGAVADALRDRKAGGGNPGREH
ncbi:hypothetical protein ACFV0C_37985 [Streptomyces sp. NPDC059568]|uniref:hypothetical protein n=1 Tax=Streptomyces sp. NPDC059568 TaxID=3346868 RepID=UPI0036AEAA97